MTNANANANANDTTVERWNQFEVAFEGPSTGNPFVDVDLTATFTLEHAQRPAFVLDDELELVVREKIVPKMETSVPDPLVAFDFSTGNSTNVPNTGTSAASTPNAQVREPVAL